MADSTREEQLAAILRRYVDTWNAGNSDDVLAMHTDDIDAQGVGGCPCKGKQEFFERFVARTMAGGWKMEALPSRYILPDIIQCYFLSRIDFDAQPKFLRGRIEYTIRGDKICAVRACYDLTDPQTVLARGEMGDSIFSLVEPNGFQCSPWRCIIIDQQQTAVRVGLLHNDWGVDCKGFVPSISSDPQGNHLVHELSPVVRGQSESRIPVSQAVLVNSPHYVVMRNDRGEVVGMGRVPPPLDGP